MIWLRLCVFSLINRPIMPLFSVVSRQTNFPHINISTPCFIMTKNNEQKNKLYLRLQVNQYAKMIEGRVCNFFILPHDLILVLSVMASAM